MRVIGVKGVRRGHEPGVEAERPLRGADATRRYWSGGEQRPVRHLVRTGRSGPATTTAPATVRCASAHPFAKEVSA